MHNNILYTYCGKESYAQNLYKVTNLEQFDIDLKGMVDDKLHLTYNINDEFFGMLESEDPARGKLTADVTIRKSMQAFEVTICCNGYVVVQCDRCLDDMKLKIDTEDVFMAKFGDEDDYEDEVVTVSEIKGTINLARLIREFISLAIPIQHIHEEGECNVEMAEKLKEHTAHGLRDNDEEDNGNRPVDPRWEELKKILDNN